MEWTRGPAIGRGSTATVSLATTTISGNLFAVKSTELSNSLFLQREQSFLSKSNSPHIVNYLGSDITHESGKLIYNLHMEYLSSGTLHDAIRLHGGRLEEQVIGLYAREILQGVKYLHEIGLAHCDIKSQNILLAGKSAVKIVDLGCAKLVGESVGISGSPAFMAPEVACGEEQGFAADIWGLGCTVIEMATGSNPWPELRDPVSALYTIGFSGRSPDIPRWLSATAKDFLAKCLMKDPRERRDAEELLKHPFVAENHIKNLNSDSDSPCSVLNQTIWDSIEVFSENSHESSYSNFVVAAERIGNLITSEPNWSSDEDWITVRSAIGDEVEENMVYEQEIDDDNSIYFLLDDHIIDQNIIGVSRNDDEFVWIDLNFETNNIKNSCFNKLEIFNYKLIKSFLHVSLSKYVFVRHLCCTYHFCSRL